MRCCNVRAREEKNVGGNSSFKIAMLDSFHNGNAPTVSYKLRNSVITNYLYIIRIGGLTVCIVGYSFQFSKCAFATNGFRIRTFVHALMDTIFTATISCRVVGLHHSMDDWFWKYVTMRQADQSSSKCLIIMLQNLSEFMNNSWTIFTSPDGL